jgi:hypothetical protein
MVKPQHKTSAKLVAEEAKQYRSLSVQFDLHHHAAIQNLP